MTIRGEVALTIRGLLLAAAAVVLGACGTDDTSAVIEGGTTIDAREGPDDVNDVWNRHHLPDGTYVWCLTSDSGGGHYAIRGMSCDWVGYHEEFGVRGEGR